MSTYRGNQPLLAVAMQPYGADALAGQKYFPVPGGVVPGLNIVGVGGAMLSPGDFSDLDGLGIDLSPAYPNGLAVGTRVQVYSMTYNTNYVPVQGQLAPNRNKIINGNFDIWQRGTSLAVGTTYRFIADRWATEGVVSTLAPSQQAFALGQVDVPGNPRYFHRAVVVSSAGSNNYARLTHRVEGVSTLAGQPAILSFYAKADASKNIAAEFTQLFGTGGSPSATVTAIGVTTCALTTAWQQFKVPVTIPSIAGKTLGTGADDYLQLAFWFDAGSSFNARTNSLGQQSGTFDIARVQLEPGSVATAYEDEEIGAVLRKCQRFFWSSHAGRSVNDSAGAKTMIGVANTLLNGSVCYPVTMRVAPAVVLSNPNTGAANNIRWNGSNLAVGAVELSHADGFSQVSVASGGSTGTGCYFHVDASAEL